MQFDRRKLKAVILHTCAKCEQSRLGAVKLHKVLYFSDMLHYAHVGAPMMGCTYRKRAFGPACDQLLPALRELHKEGAIEIRDVDYFGFSRKEYLPLIRPELDRLCENELAVVNEMVEFVCCNNTAKPISDSSHNRAWDMAELGDVLPYHSVFHLFPTQVSQEAFDSAADEVAHIEDPRSRGEAMGGESFRAFRSRVLETGKQ